MSSIGTDPGPFDTRLLIRDACGTYGYQIRTGTSFPHLRGFDPGTCVRKWAHAGAEMHMFKGGARAVS